LGYSPKKFINIIEGKNGTGKTTIFNAILWSLSHEKNAEYFEIDHLLNKTVGDQIKNSQRSNVKVQIFLSKFETNQKMMVEREWIYVKKNKKPLFESESVGAKELVKSVWTDCDYDSLKDSILPKKLVPFFFLNEELGKTTITFENILPVLKELSEKNPDELKKIISEKILVFWKKIGKYSQKPVVKFDDQDQIQLIYNNNSCWNSLASGDQRVLIYALLASLKSVLKLNFPLIIDSPFSRLDELKRTNIANSIEEHFINGQMILFGTDLEFDQIDKILEPITNKYIKINYDEKTGNSSFSQSF